MKHGKLAAEFSTYYISASQIPPITLLKVKTWKNKQNIYQNQ
jgi:hypothetical protein